MTNIDLLTSSLLLLLIGNAVIWFAPLFLQRFDIFRPQGMLVYVFSSSYWLPIIFLIFEPYGYIPPNVYEAQCNYVAAGSLWAGIGYFLAYLLYNRRIAKRARRSKKSVLQFFSSSSLKFWIVQCYLIGIMILFYCLFEAYPLIDKIARRTFYNARPFWYFEVLPIAGYIIGVGNFLYFLAASRKKSRFLTLLMFLSTYFICIMNGFDGGRRSAAFTVFMAIIGYIFNIMVLARKKREAALSTRRFVGLFLSAAVLITFLSTARLNQVGWNVTLKSTQYIGQDVRHGLYSTLTMIFSPTSTLHVNTRMAEYIDFYGTQGYINYLRAIGNTLIPEFLIGEYYFGLSVKLQLHAELNLYGQDFGLLAESIYSGGLLGCSLVHFVLGVIANQLYLYWLRGKNVPGIFYLTFIIAALNSVRADMMVFLKVWIYIGVVLSCLYWLFLKRFMIFTRVRKHIARPIIHEKRQHMRHPEESSHNSQSEQRSISP